MSRSYIARDCISKSIGSDTQCEGCPPFCTGRFGGGDIALIAGAQGLIICRVGFNKYRQHLNLVARYRLLKIHKTDSDTLLARKALELNSRDDRESTP